MKIEIIENEIKKPEYPYIGGVELNGNIVLFTSAKAGVVLNAHAKSTWHIGDYYDNWAEREFTPLPNGTKIVLSNE